MARKTVEFEKHEEYLKFEGKNVGILKKRCQRPLDLKNLWKI